MPSRHATPVATALLVSLTACAATAPAPTAPEPAAPLAEPAAAPVAEAPLEKVDADTPKKTPTGGALVVPKGWWVKARPDGFVFEEPDRELTVTLLEMEVVSTEQALHTAWASLGKVAPPKVKHTS